MTLDCANPGCVLPLAPKSKYCAVHKREAAAAWRAMIADKAANRADNKKMLVSLVYDSVLNATNNGINAARLASVEPIGIVTDSQCPDQPFYVSSGICGFAWVVVKGARGLLRSELLEHGFAPHYGGGLSLWISEHGQSYDRKQAHAREFADSLRESFVHWGPDYFDMSKIDISYGSRVD